MITIKEISDMVGVSPTTVSNVIHGNTKKVSKENVERITQVLKETNYIPRLGLNALKQRQSKIVGVVIRSAKYYEHTILADPFYGQLVGELEKGIREAGYYMMFYAAEDIEDIVRMAVAWNVDGLIAITFTQDNYSKIKSFVNKPVVAIDLIKSPGGESVSETVSETGKEAAGEIYNIGLDDRNGGYLMTRHILRQGYQKIFILATKDEGVDHERFLGYRQALEEAGLPFRKEWFIKLSENSKKRRENMKRLLKFTGRDIALFFLADVYAIEAVSYFQSENIRLPEELSIAGFDNSLLNEYVFPRLTTIHQDIGEKANRALGMLAALINGETVPERDVKLPVYLITGQTVGRRS